ncbi:MAG: ribonuclease H-like domain-containing protein [Spirochaetales bacterium]|nr:ribonuclease H-like domain-containing protein [Spirochaetales bacterium]
MGDYSSSSFKSKLAYLGLLTPKHSTDEEKSKQKRSVSFILPKSWDKVGEFTYTKIEGVKNPITFSDYSICPLIPPESEPGELLFFDLETTGLSGGAGTLCFLIGIGRIREDMFEIRQIFLSDFPGEGEFLSEIAPFFRKENLFVSFNGKSFDSHFIKTRFLMNRMKCEIEKQFDLLHVSRRFFKHTIGSCSLGDIEEKVLSIHRDNDVDGFEVPDIYFNFLQTGNTADLTRVFEHNFQDILSLAHLFQCILTLSTPGSHHSLLNVDDFALGQYFLESGNDDGINLLTRAYEKGDIRAGKYLSLYFKKKQEWDKAVLIWERMVCDVKSCFAVIELAKYYEHREKDYKKALVWVEKVSDFKLPLSMQDRIELIKRKERILKKVENS